MEACQGLGRVPEQPEGSSGMGAAANPRIEAHAEPRSTVQVRETATDTLVTAIEVLSPVNKRGDGLSLYRAKRKSLIQTEVHLIELDLLRGGERPGWEVKEPPLVCEYMVLVHRASGGDMRRSEIWPVVLHEPLPLCPVPRCHRMRMCLYHLARCWRRYTSGRPMPGALTTRCQCRLPRYVRRCSTGVLPMSHRPPELTDQRDGACWSHYARSVSSRAGLEDQRCQSLR